MADQRFGDVDAQPAEGQLGGDQRAKEVEAGLQRELLVLVLLRGGELDLGQHLFPVALDAPPFLVLFGLLLLLGPRRGVER